MTRARALGASRPGTIAACTAVVVALLVGGTRPAQAIDHTPWDGLLHRYVDDAGRVAYADLRAHDADTLAAYLRALAAADPSAQSTAEAKAFWINAYNAAVVSAVLAGYSAENLLRRHSLFTRFRVAVAGAPRTLDEIEHGIIRPTFHDPRMHFALVCASSSCPRLRRAAYRGDDVESALDAEARRFVNDSSRNVFDAAGGRIRLSSIFHWFASDFRDAAGTVAAFVARYVDDDRTRVLLAAHADAITYLDYDWTLNAQPGQRP